MLLIMGVALCGWTWTPAKSIAELQQLIKEKAKLLFQVNRLLGKAGTKPVSKNNVCLPPKS